MFQAGGEEEVDSECGRRASRRFCHPLNELLKVKLHSKGHVPICTRVTEHLHASFHHLM